MDSPIKDKVVREIIPTPVFTGYDVNGQALYKGGLMAKTDLYPGGDGWLGNIEQCDIFNHLIERIEKLEEQNKLLCKALGIRRNRYK